MCKFASLCVRPCRVECVEGRLARLRARVSKSERTHARTHARMRARTHTQIIYYDVIIDHTHIWPGLYVDQQGLYLEPRQKGIDRMFFFPVGQGFPDDGFPLYPLYHAFR